MSVICQFAHVYMCACLCVRVCVLHLRKTLARVEKAQQNSTKFEKTFLIVSLLHEFLEVS